MIFTYIRCPTSFHFSLLLPLQIMVVVAAAAIVVYENNPHLWLLVRQNEVKLTNAVLKVMVLKNNYL
jgi:hypothetical protein